MSSHPGVAITDAHRRGSVLAGTLAFGLAFGWVEAVVVVYLRRLYYADGFRFPLVLAPNDIGAIEVLREAATLVMLAAAGWIGARTGWGRFGLFAVAFGTWDLAYYAGLWLALGWPGSLGDWDVLFLIPGIWTGPVWTAVLVAALLVVLGARLHAHGERGRLGRPRWRHWVMGAGSLVAIVGAFLANHDLALHGGVPRDFPVLVFLSGVAVGCATFFDLVWASGPGSRGKA